MTRSGSFGPRRGRADERVFHEVTGDGVGYRHARLQLLVRRELEGILRDEITDPHLHSVRITHVALSVDYRHARIHYTVSQSQHASDSRATREAFARAEPFLRRRLADAIDLKRVPDLRFVLDAEVVD